MVRETPCLRGSAGVSGPGNAVESSVLRVMYRPNLTLAQPPWQGLYPFRHPCGCPPKTPGWDLVQRRITRYPRPGIPKARPFHRMKTKTIPILACLASLFVAGTSLADQTTTLPRPDGEPADMSKPVQVFILLGQSNMLGFGDVAGERDGTLENAVKSKGLYPYLIDDEGNWTERKDVRNVRVMVARGGGMGVHQNDWLTIKGGRIGPEIGIGHHLGNLIDAPVLILKSCIGNRSLGWDLLPPGSEQFEHEGRIYAGYKESPDSWPVGEEPEPIGWYAGKQYDDDIANAKKVLEELDTYYPGATEYEVAGFFWWQGDKDRYNAAHAMRYEENLVRLIHVLREDFDAPDAKFVCATLGQTEKGAGGNDGLLLEAKMAVDGESGRYPEFKGNVATVYTHPLSKGGASNGHYGNNAETFMNVGEAMGEAMVRLLEGDN